MKGHRTRRDVLDGILDVDIRTASHADMKFWKPQDELLHQVKNLLTRGWNFRCIGILVERIHDQIHWTLIRKSEHLL